MLCLLTSWLKRYNNDRNKLWRELIDFKYGTSNSNIFHSKINGASEFFKGFMWAAQAARMGFKWKIGNGCKVRFFGR